MYNDNNNSGHCSFFQLALYIHDDGKGVALTDVPFMCTEAQRDDCSTVYPLKFPDCVSIPFPSPDIPCLCITRGLCKVNKNPK